MQIIPGFLYNLTARTDAVITFDAPTAHRNVAQGETLAGEVVAQTADGYLALRVNGRLAYVNPSDFEIFVAKDAVVS